MWSYIFIDRCYYYLVLKEEKLWSCVNNEGIYLGIGEIEGKCE